MTQRCPGTPKRHINRTKWLRSGTLLNFWGRLNTAALTVVGFLASAVGDLGQQLGNETALKIAQ